MFPWRLSETERHRFKLPLVLFSWQHPIPVGPIHMCKTAHTHTHTHTHTFITHLSIPVLLCTGLVGQRRTQKTLSQCVCVCVCVRERGGGGDGGAFRGTVGTWQWHPETFLSLTPFPNPTSLLSPGSQRLVLCISMCVRERERERERERKRGGDTVSLPHCQWLWKWEYIVSWFEAAYVYRLRVGGCFWE